MDLSWLCFVVVLLIMIPVIYYGITSRLKYGKQLLKAQRTSASKSHKSTRTVHAPQESRSISITFRRESVTAGDDVDAPHEKKINIEMDESIENTLKKILASHYLPGIRGGKATWIVLGKNPIAVVAQQWSKPHYFVETVTPVNDLVESTADHQLKFLYWCQVEPNRVIESIENDKPLPDKFGRD